MVGKIRIGTLMNSKSNLVLAIMGLMVLLSSMAGYYYWQRRPVSWYLSRVLSTPVSVWATYRDDKYGYEIKYPDDAAIKKSSIAGGEEVLIQLNLDTKKVNPSVTAERFHIQIIDKINYRDIKDSDNCTFYYPSMNINNSVNFFRIDVGENFKKVDTSASAMEFCTINGDVMYKLITELEYSRSGSAGHLNINVELVDLDKMLSTFKLTEFKNKTLGTLNGNINFEPFCSSERADSSCVVSPEVYTNRQIYVYSLDSKVNIAKDYIRNDRRYTFPLPVGQYIVDINKTPSGVGASKDLPKTIVISAGATTTLDFSIDTGIHLR